MFNRKTPLLIVLSGPSGAGKDAILNRMRRLNSPVEFITTATTRSRRATERDNIDYYFISNARFKQMIEAGELLEYANVYNNWYGVPKQPVRDALERGQDVIVKVDIQGAATIKKLVPEAVFIFVMTPTIEELKMRLTRRQTESPVDLELRFRMAEAEVKQMSFFDYVVLNQTEELDKAVSDIIAIITAEKCRISPRLVKL